MKRIGALVASIGLGVVVSVAAAQPGGDRESRGRRQGADPRIDAATGRDMRVWPHPRHFDHLHMRLDIDIPTMDKPRAAVTQSLRLAAIGRERDRVLLDAGPAIRVRSVTLGGRSLEFSHEGEVLSISLARPAEPDVPFDLIIAYDLDYSRSAGGFLGGAITWTSGDPDSDDPDRVAPQLHTQGQPEFNHYWFPCHDFPNERLSTEIVVTTEDGYDVISNGRRVSSELIADGRRRTHWLQERPHVAYLATLVIGRFDRVELGGPDSARPGLPMTLWAPVGKGDSARVVFRDTARMIAFFEERLDEPYPWDKYDQVLARAYMSGAMENTSASTFFPVAADSGPDSMDDIISHELFHQWTGDLITCRSWEHIWLNEGWASYGEALWAEEKARQDEGEEAARDAYLSKIRGFMRGQRGNRGSAPYQPALASNLYGDPFEVFAKSDNPYPKGAMVLHMLRMGLGDEAFFRGVALYIDRWKDNCAETDDFRQCLEEASGESLEQFFDQWVYRPGVPRLEIEYDNDADSGVLTVTVRQTQTINADNPAYEFFLPLYVEGSGGGRYVYVDVRDEVTRQSFEVRGTLQQISIDPNLRVACSRRVTKDFE
ncbi:MAG: M1 family metallopeptidase [Phycisphaeraceae bacterium]|nr:M1 family metallopeptidase [Phycisphaeraceae bacterium]